MLSAMAQCYLPGKMADNMHSHEKSDHLMSILPPTLFPHSYPHNCCCFLTHFYLDSHLWALNQLSVLFLAVSTLKKVKTAQTLCPSVVFPLFSPQLLVLSDSFLSVFTSLNIRSTLCAVSGCLWLSKPSKKRKLCLCLTLLVLCSYGSAATVWFCLVLPSIFWTSNVTMVQVQPFARTYLFVLKYSVPCQFCQFTC